MVFYYISVAIILNHILIGVIMLIAPKISSIHNKLLAGQLFCIVTIHFVGLFIFWHKPFFYKYLIGVEYIAGSLFAVFFYFYTYSYIKEELPPRKEIIRNLLAPGIFVALYGFIHLYHQSYIKLANIGSSAYSTFIYTCDILNWLIIIHYVGYSYYIFRRAKKKSTGRKIHIQWLTIYFRTTFIVCIIAFPSGFIKNGETMGPYLTLITLIYYVVLMWQSIGTSRIFTVEVSNNQYPPNLEETDFLFIHQYFIAEKPHTNQDLTLESLAEQMDISKNKLSHIINTQLGMNFFELVNSYRVKDAQQLLLNPAYQNYTIDAIAQEAGFKSRTSFYEAFKKQTGMTPSEFRINSIVKKN